MVVFLPQVFEGRKETIVPVVLQSTHQSRWRRGKSTGSNDVSEHEHRMDQLKVNKSKASKRIMRPW